MGVCGQFFSNTGLTFLTVIVNHYYKAYKYNNKVSNKHEMIIYKTIINKFYIAIAIAIVYLK